MRGISPIQDSKQESFSNQDKRYSKNDTTQQLQIALVEKLRLEEIVDFIKEESQKYIEEISTYKNKVEQLEKELKDVSQAMVINQSQAVAFHSQNKRIEDQLNSSNFHFVNAQKKLSLLEKENKELIERIQALEIEKKKVSQKWSAASQKVKAEEKMKIRMRELEIEVQEQKEEAEEFKKKYVQTNTELRVYKEGEFNYKDIVESRFKQLKERLIDEQQQNEDLLQQNNLLVLQLEDFAAEIACRQNKLSIDEEEGGGQGGQQFKKELRKYSKNHQEQLNYQDQEIEYSPIEKNTLKQNKGEQEAFKTLAFAKIKDKQDNTKTQQLPEDLSQQISAIKDSEKEDLKRELEQSQEQISQLKKQSAKETDLLLFLKQEKQHLLSELEELKVHNIQLKEKITKSLQENCNELELLEKVSSKNTNLECQQEFQQLCDILLLCSDRKLADQIKIRVVCILQLIATSNTVCKECQKQITGRGQQSLEKQLGELKALYDRLLAKHSILQNKYSEIESELKSQSLNINNQLKQHQNNIDHVDQVEEQTDNNNDAQSPLLRSNGEGESNQFFNNYYKKSHDEDSSKINNMNKDKMVADSKCNNYQLIQTILKNGFSLRENLSEGSQKMLQSLFGKLLESQNLTDQLNFTVNPKHQELSSNCKASSSSFKSSRGLPIHTLERSQIKRKKSKENYPISNDHYLNNVQGCKQEYHNQDSQSRDNSEKQSKIKIEEKSKAQKGRIKNNLNLECSQGDYLSIFRKQSNRQGNTNQMNNSFDHYSSSSRKAQQKKNNFCQNNNYGNSITASIAQQPFTVSQNHQPNQLNLPQSKE